jgi:hypothetical protein
MTANNPSTSGRRWRVPSQREPHLSPAATATKDLWSLHGWLTSEPAGNLGLRWKPFGDRHTTLMFFPANRGTPFLIPLWLEESSGGGRPLQQMPNAPWAPHTRLLAAGDGLVMLDRRVPKGFWSITRAELDPFLQAQEQLVKDETRAKQKSVDDRDAKMRQNVIAQFDKNGDGVLSPAEERAAMDHPFYQRLKNQEIITRWLQQADDNADGELDATEYATLAGKPVDLVGRAWTPPPFAEALKLDRNRDFRLDRVELEVLLQAARNAPVAQPK